MDLQVFWFGHVPRSRIKSKGIFLIKCYIITFLKTNCGAFCPTKWRSKRNFPLYFQQVIWVGGGGDIFLPKFFSSSLEKPNTPEYAQVLVVTWAKLNSFTALLLLSPRPTLIPDPLSPGAESVVCHDRQLHERQEEGLLGHHIQRGHGR